MPAKRSRKKQQPQKASNVELSTIIGNREAPAVSADQIRLLYSFFNFTLLVATLRPDQKGEFALHEAVSLSLSPQHFKALSALFNVKVAEYEETFGPIPVVTEETETKLLGTG